MKNLAQNTIVISFLSFFLIFAVASTAVAQTVAQAVSQGEEIRRIEVQGTQRIEAQTILSYMTVKPGDPFSADTLDESLKSLFDTGLFSDVRFAKNARTLIVNVKENPVINQLAFEGNLRINDSKLSPEVQLQERVIFTKSKAQSDVARIQEVYRRSGRFAVKVEPKIIELDQNRVDLVFEIDEGAETKIKNVSFVNNKAFDDNELSKVIVSHVDRWYRFLSSNDSYDPDRLDFDKELLRRYYLQNGYADFKVTSAIAELSQDKEGFFLTFSVDEGVRYKVADVTVKNRLQGGVDTSVLAQEVLTLRGEWFNNLDVADTEEALTKAVEAQLFPFVRVQSETNLNRETQTVDIDYVITEGPRVFVDRIEVGGNVRTIDRVIRREMEMVEGDPLNRSRVQRSEANLRDLGFFETVEVTTKPGSAPDSVNVDVEVSEQSTGQLSIGAGFSSQDGPLADFGIRERNFLGRGQELNLTTVLAGERSEVDLGFVEPYFLGRDLRFSSNVFHITRDLQDESSFDQRRTGTGFSLGYPLARDLRHSLSYRFVSNDISDVSSDASRFIREQEGKRSTSAIGHTLTLDKTNSRITPTEGYSLSFSNELAGLGGDAKFFNTEVGGSYFYPVTEDLILSTSAKTGWVLAYNDDDVAINDRYFIGDNTFRGFEQSGIGPRDVSTDDALGGERYYRGSVELSFPIGLPDEYGIKGHTFTDIGSLWDNVDSSAANVEDESSLRMSAGAGISWVSPIGPIRVNFAWPLIKEDYDKDQVVNFSFGTTF